jgi:hypothetical protein
VSCAIVCSGIEKVYAMVEGTMDGANGFFIIDLSPASGILAAISIQPIPRSADCLAAKSHRTYFEITAP